MLTGISRGIPSLDAVAAHPSLAATLPQEARSVLCLRAAAVIAALLLAPSADRRSGSHPDAARPRSRRRAAKVLAIRHTPSATVRGAHPGARSARGRRGAGR